MTRLSSLIWVQRTQCLNSNSSMLRKTTHRLFNFLSIIGTHSLITTIGPMAKPPSLLESIFLDPFLINLHHTSTAHSITVFFMKTLFLVKIKWSSTSIRPMLTLANNIGTLLFESNLINKQMLLNLMLSFKAFQKLPTMASRL